MKGMLTTSQKEIKITYLNIHRTKLNMYENLQLQPVIALQANMLQLDMLWQ